MKITILVFIASCLFGRLAGQVERISYGSLTAEESRLIQAFRQDPQVFRRVLNGQFAPTGDRVPEVERVEVLGPRDVIDVIIRGGKVAFYGKPHEYEAVSFRMRRGEDRVIIFARDQSSIETRVRVAFRSDGLHFDVPESYGGRTAEERGLLVVDEDNRWRTGEPIVQQRRLESYRSVSKAEGLVFSCRYVATR